MRVVSLVPSATETLRALGVEPIACTRFCEQPDLPTVGGTKDPHVDEIVALHPDLVVMNDEENRVEDAGALESAGLRVHSMSPRSVGDVGPAVETLARTVGAAIPSPFGPTEWPPWVDEQRARGRGDARRRRTAVMVWRRPWMTMNGDTYGSSLVALLGLDNLFGDAPERYPEVTLEQVAARSPDVVLLPNEPYPFRERHLAGVAAEMPSVDVRLVDGRDLFWWGIRTPAGVDSLRRACA